VIHKDNLVTIWIVVGFVSMIGLFFENSIKTVIAYGLVTLTLVSFGLGLYFTDLSEVDKKNLGKNKINSGK